ncbi:hypothetical protein [Leeia sp.]|uniref:hypothetical protein n=1 Tax=Leeia sp. TaxID=2884678 RepID=UPI0035B1AB68
MKMSISAALHAPDAKEAPYPVWTIDGVPLDEWLEKSLGCNLIKGLVPAYAWLIDDDDLALARKRLKPHAQDCSTIVPLLICSDDLDFRCTCVVVEQVTSGSQVTWRRFGFDCTDGSDHVGSSVMWVETGGVITFEASQLKAAIAEFERLTVAI